MIIFNLFKYLIWCSGLATFCIFLFSRWEIRDRLVFGSTVIFEQSFPLSLCFNSFYFYLYIISRYAQNPQISYLETILNFFSDEITLIQCGMTIDYIELFLVYNLKILKCKIPDIYVYDIYTIYMYVFKSILNYLYKFSSVT